MFRKTKKVASTDTESAVNLSGSTDSSGELPKSKKSRASKIVRNVLISVFVLLILFGGAGVAYVYFLGNSENEAVAPEPTPTQVPAKPVEPPKPSPNTKASASVQSLTSPVTPGSNATIDVKTVAGSDCKIVVEYNKVPSKDSGLTPKKADEFGIVSWTWTVERTVPLGTWPATVTCVFNTRSAVVRGDLVVASKVN